MYDTETDTWFEQDTTAEGGTYPAPRADFCSVAVSAADGSSHSVYVYGGQYGDSSDSLDDIWILTLPAFHWIPVTVDSEPRYSLACAVLANKYLVTYGGASRVFRMANPNKVQLAL